MKTFHFAVWLSSFLLLSVCLRAASKKVILGPSGSEAFGGIIYVLANGNFIVIDSGFDQPAPALSNNGIVYFYRHDGTLINFITGTSTNDRVGIDGVTILENGNFVVRSNDWNGLRGATTWGHAETGFIGGGGAVSAANSLVGTTASDSNSSRLTKLSNGHYVLTSPNWNNGGTPDVGAVTWCNGQTGRVGVIDISNSLVGSVANDRVGETNTVALPNGNVVVTSPNWNNGAFVDAGAVTWINGTTGLIGTINSGNSLLGGANLDKVGSTSVTVLTNGNYVVASKDWNGSSGAVTWGNGTTGVSGIVSNTNSLVGAMLDNVGDGVLALTNGNYVVLSTSWSNPDTAASFVGAVTWCNGTTGQVGLVSTINSLVGTTALDRIGLSGVFSLRNGNYVVRSNFWDNGIREDAGAVTWGNGSTGTTGAVSPANSLVGGSDFDYIGEGGVYPLSNGNYVVVSIFWDSDTFANVGAVTWGNGSSGVSGLVSAANSLVGSAAADSVGSGTVIALPNGNYVVGSPQWNNGTTNDAGAATWGDGKKGIKGTISAANSLVGSSALDAVGNVAGLITLKNGNYLVQTTNWDNGSIMNAGAVTWGSATTGVKGVISVGNSLVGSSTNDRVGNSGICLLENGHYVVCSADWDNGPISNAGAATWGDGTKGVRGVVSASNSLVGSTTSDAVGSYNVALTNSNYVVSSQGWDNGLLVNAGHATWGDGKKGVKGPVTRFNSLVGESLGDFVGVTVTALADGNYIVVASGYDIPLPNLLNASARTLCDGMTGRTGFPSTSDSVFGSIPSSSLASTYSQKRAQMIVGESLANRITILSNNLRTVARSGEAASGATDIAWAKPGLTAVNAAGDILFDTALTGSGSKAGRNRAIYALNSFQPEPALVMQAGDSLNSIIPSGAKTVMLSAPVFQQTGRGLFQTVISGPNINATNNRILFRDNGFTITPLHRSGDPITVLGGAAISKFVEVLASHDQDLVMLHYQLRAGSTTGVNASNDSGLLLMNHNGSFSNVIAAREGSTAATFALTGTLGQITRASAGNGVRSYFITALKPAVGPPGSAVCGFANNGALYNHSASTGNSAPGAAPANYRTFTSLTSGGTNVIYKATLTGPTAENEGVWRNTTMVIRKGADVNNGLYGGVKFGKIIRIWASNPSATQLVVHCTLTGAGVNNSNNQALVLIQATNGNTILMRTGTDPNNTSPVARGINSATIRTITAVDVNPTTGRYTVLTNLAGSPAAQNQALWTGEANAGNDTTQRTLREPTLRLRKGERYTSSSTALGIVKGISLTPAPDPSGSGSRGLAHCIGGNGQVTATIIADRNLTELVLLP